MEQTTFLCSAFCIIMMPEGQLIHWNLFSVGGGKPKIAASDCHTIGLDCTVQLCTEPVCLSFNWLLHGCQPIRCIITEMWTDKHTTKFISNSFQKHGVKNCVYIEHSVWLCIKQFLKIYSIFDYHNATMAEFKAWILQLQIWAETTPNPFFY